MEINPVCYICFLKAPEDRFALITEGREVVRRYDSLQVLAAHLAAKYGNQQIADLSRLTPSTVVTETGPNPKMFGAKPMSKAHLDEVTRALAQLKASQGVEVNLLS